MADLEEISENCGINLYEGINEDDAVEIDTINSLILHLIQRVPEKGEIINGFNGIKFKIVDADFSQVLKVVIIKPQQEQK